MSARTDPRGGRWATGVPTALSWLSGVRTDNTLQLNSFLLAGHPEALPDGNLWFEADDKKQLLAQYPASRFYSSTYH
jgi:hypothetical protein